ncbi:FecR family protein [Chitinophaga sp. GCM10012297]|uniref:FecR domain-containing protein n=1 Tax=Chitinophaga chungangae TaxID=2821488 RepID=A0ABS3YKV8_9BACT|nr:FecR domain-containing protein [Chitinophaga chungangae]MBO9155323.1 FecR domain-containing protein [Chitinophaga chungangae]
MDENQDHIKSLFIRLAEGKSTPGERLQLLEYLRRNPSPQALPELEELANEDSWPLMPGAEAENILARILRQEEPAIVRPMRKRNWLKIAAAALPVIGVAGLALWLAKEPRRIQYANDTKSVQTIRLSDGSIVSLNQQARVSVSADGRETWLEGEAFFSVQPSDKKPFTVHTAHSLDVTVLGTAFNVNAQKNGTQVVLNAGRVKVGTGETQMVLNPGEMADYHAATGKLLRQQADTLLFTSWKYDLIAFKARPLKEVMEKLGEQYGIGVVFDHAGAENLVFTGYLSSNDLPQALLTLEQAFTLKITLLDKQLHVNIK